MDSLNHSDGWQVPGYTCSLLFFIAPAAILGLWFVRRSSGQQRRVFCQALGLLVMIGLVLDALFGPTFFAWPNAKAIVGIWVPAVGGAVPVEEIVFFVSGFAFLLLTYVWCDESWLAAYQRTFDATGSHATGRWIRAGLVGAIFATLAGAIAYKKLLAANPNGFPGYLAYVLLVAILPPVWCFPWVMTSINWRAFSFTQLAMALVCLTWEVTLALPRLWWAYEPDMMTGIQIRAWSNLPIEQPLVWLASPFTTVVTYELLRLRRV